MKNLPAFLLLLISVSAFAQREQNRFWKEIQTLKQRDSATPPPRNPIVFTGSSSFRLWDNLTTVFGKYEVVNSAFGGSKVDDVTLFAEDVTTRYQPRQVVLYAGDNDLGDEGTTADTIFVRFKNLYTKIRADLPHVPIAFLSIKPSIRREVYMGKAREANEKIHRYLDSQPLTDFIDIFPLMLDAGGKPRKELFKADGLHPNAACYEIWEKAIEPYLLKKP